MSRKPTATLAECRKILGNLSLYSERLDEEMDLQDGAEFGDLAKRLRSAYAKASFIKINYEQRMEIDRLKAEINGI